MKPHALSIAYQTDKPLAAYGKLASAAEAYGFDAITVYNDLFFQPAWLPLMEIARHTSRARIGVAAVNPFTCHPINIAGNIALIDAASGGRAYLGLARGGWLTLIGVYPQREITALREAFICVQHLLSGNKQALEADIFPVTADAGLRWNIHRKELPFLLGSWGIKTITACAAEIEEYKLGGSANPAIIDWYRKHLTARAARTNIVMGAVTVVDEDGARARNLARRELALYLPVVAELDKTVEIEPDRLAGIKKAAAVHDYEKAAAFISDDMLRPFALAGTPADIVAQTEALFDAGAARVEYGTPHGISSESGLRLLGEKVLPALLKIDARDHG